MKSLINYYHESKSRKFFHKKRRELLVYIDQHSPLSVDAEKMRTRRSVFDAPTNPYKFYVDHYCGPIRCEGRRGNLFKGFRSIKNAGDGLNPRAKMGNMFARFARPTVKLDFALSLHTPHPKNYYHFFAHTLPKMVYAEKVYNSLTFPLLVSDQMAGQPFFVEAAELGIFGDHPVIVQKQGETYLLKEMTIARPAHQPEGFFDEVLDRLGIAGDATANNRVFIQRGPKSANKRNIENMDEASAVLRKYEFDLVDPQDFSLKQQIELFSRARYVASPHGAGLTNIAFRRSAPLGVYEIHYHNGQNSCYARMCRYFNYDYQTDFMAKTIGKFTTGSAVIDCNKLENWLRTTHETQ